MPLAQHMNQGYMAGRGPESPGLEAQNERWSSMIHQNLGRPTSVLQQISPSPIAANLSAPSQRERLLGNGLILPNLSNGASSGTAETDLEVRMAGGGE